MIPRKGFRCAPGSANDDQTGPIPESLTVHRDARIGNADAKEIPAIGEGLRSDEIGLFGKNDMPERTAHESLFRDRLQVIRQDEIRIDIDQNRAAIKRDFVAFIVIERDTVVDYRLIILRDCAQSITGQEVNGGDPVAIAG